jgi:hypothetical protein
MRLTWTKRESSIDAVSWTALVAAIDCNYVSIRNDGPGALKWRDALNTSTSEDTIGAGTTEVLIATDSRLGFFEDASGRSSPFRFKAGDPVAYLQAASGTVTVKATFAI